MSKMLDTDWSADFAIHDEREKSRNFTFSILSPNLQGWWEGLQEDLEVEHVNAQIGNSLSLLHMFGNRFVSKSIALYIV